MGSWVSRPERHAPVTGGVPALQSWAFLTRLGFLGEGWRLLTSPLWQEVVFFSLLSQGLHRAEEAGESEVVSNKPDPTLPGGLCGKAGRAGQVCEASFVGCGP